MSKLIRHDFSVFYVAFGLASVLVFCHLTKARGINNSFQNIWKLKYFSLDLVCPLSLFQSVQVQLNYVVTIFGSGTAFFNQSLTKSI